MLVTFGIMYEDSKYNGNSENTRSGLGSTELSLLDWFCTPSTTTEYTKYASEQLAPKLFELGYCFEPNEDFSNIEVGDILIWNRDTANDDDVVDDDDGTTRWRGVDHTSIAGSMNPDGTFSTWEAVGGTDGGEGGPAYSTYQFAYVKPRIILVARLRKPMANYVNERVCSYIMPPKTGHSNLWMSFEASLKAFTPYTIMAKLKSDNTASSNDYVFVRDRENKPIVSFNKNNKNKLVSRVVYLDHDVDFCAVWINTDNDVAKCTLESFEIYEGINKNITDNYKISLDYYEANEYNLTNHDEDELKQILIDAVASIRRLAYKEIYIRTVDNTKETFLGHYNWIVSVTRFNNQYALCDFSSYMTKEKYRVVVDSLENTMSVENYTDVDNIVTTQISLTAGTNHAAFGGCYFTTDGKYVSIHLGIIGLATNEVVTVGTLPEWARPKKDIVLKCGGVNWYDTESVTIAPSSGNIRVKSTSGGIWLDAVYCIYPIS